MPDENVVRRYLTAAEREKMLAHQVIEHARKAEAEWRKPMDEQDPLVYDRLWAALRLYDDDRAATKR